MDRYDGDRHGNTSKFELSVLGPGIPDGDGGFLPGTITPINVSGLSNRQEVFQTADGREHAGGKVVASEVTMEVYTNDAITVALLNAWWNASKQGLPGSKLPCTFTVRRTDETVAEAWEWEEVFVKGLEPSSFDKSTPDAAKMTVVLSVYNPQLMP